NSLFWSSDTFNLIAIVRFTKAIVKTQKFFFNTQGAALPPSPKGLGFHAVIRMNTLYFFLYFICIATFSGLRFLSLDISPYFFSYSLAQNIFEVAILALIAHFFRHRAWVFCIYFTILLLHYAHFTIHRLTDSGLGLFFKFFAGHGFNHVITVFQALNMNRSMIALIITAFCLLPFMSIGIDRITKKIVKPRNVSSLQILSVLLPMTLFLFSFEWFVIKKMPYTDYAKFQKTLTLGTTLLSPEIPCSELPVCISAPVDQNEILKCYENCQVNAKPNIYLFIIETLRKDFLTEQIAPHIHAFSRENLEFASSHSNANSTQHSWFAIFHSLLPFHWTNFPKIWKQGSAPLLILKNLGYKIHVYSSADLRYFEMDQMIFGPHRALADVIEEYAGEPLESWEKDALVMKSFEKEDSKHGNVYLFFLDATHSEYSFPKEDCFFQPIVQKIDYLTLNVNKIEPIINRYRNSVKYIDQLVNQFIKHLKNKGFYEEALIAITGDHGEEFFEEGSLFHGTHLNEAQTSVPIVFKFPNHPKVQTNSVTHIDIFPTILDYVTQINCDLFEGKSIFRVNRPQYRFAIAQNGAKTPNEFIAQSDNDLLHARLKDPENIYTNKEIEVLSAESRFPEQIFRK
ncbi:MAG TPA: sulfatase-like hydrolase/transferase, partial [Chlamydiales bacterium]|nr:sulfatase-like hydrolase/transferase [Chlamydiales bacterium]